MAKLDTMEELLEEVKALRKGMRRMQRVAKMVSIEHPGKVLSFYFLVGLVRGVGSFIGATTLAGLLLYLLTRLPWMQQIIDAIQAVAQQATG